MCSCVVYLPVPGCGWLAAGLLRTAACWEPGTATDCCGVRTARAGAAVLEMATAPLRAAPCGLRPARLPCCLEERGVED